MILLFKPFFILMSNKELIELLPFKLKFILSILLDSILVGNLVILSLQKCFETHHRRLESLQILILGFASSVKMSWRWSIVFSVISATIIPPTISVIFPPSSHPFGGRRHLMPSSTSSLR